MGYRGSRCDSDNPKNKMLLKERKVEDIFFYKNQRNAKKGVIGGKDALYKKSVQKRQERFAPSIVITQLSSDDETDVESFSQSSSAASNPCSSLEKQQVKQAGPSSQSPFVTLTLIYLRGPQKTSLFKKRYNLKSSDDKNLKF